MLRDAEVEIRPIRPRDAIGLEALLAENRRWLAQWEATYPSQRASGKPSLADVRASIRSLRAQSRAGTAAPFVVEAAGQLVGQLNVSAIARGSVSSATLGYWISQAAAGRGVMTRAVALASDYCFVQLGLHRVEICIRPENEKSLRVVAKLGFRFEGLRRRYIHINGEWADHYCFALVREEVPAGVLGRYRDGTVPVDAAAIPEWASRVAAQPLLSAEAAAEPRRLWARPE